MPQLVTIQQAARNVLASWLVAELSTVTGGVATEPRWVESDQKLPSKRITIIDAGPRDIEWLEPEALRTTNVDLEAGNPVKKVDVVWGLGFITQPIQLDVWARSDVELDDIQARLDASLNKGSRGLGLSNVDPFEPGLRRHLVDGWAPGIVDFLFEEPVLLQSPTSVGEGEWRAMYRGRATAQMTQTGRTARIARVLLKNRIYVADADLSAAPVTTVIVPDN
jgi:hypothetical protein